MINIDESVDQENDQKYKNQHPLSILLRRFWEGATLLNFLDSF